MNVQDLFVTCICDSCIKDQKVAKGGWKRLCYLKLHEFNYVVWPHEFDHVIKFIKLHLHDVSPWSHYMNSIIPRLLPCRKTGTIQSSKLHIKPHIVRHEACDQIFQALFPFFCRGGAWVWGCAWTQVLEWNLPSPAYMDDWIWKINYRAQGV